MTQSTSKIFDGARRVLAIAAVVLLGGCQVQNELTDTPLSLAAGEQCEDGETRECGRTLAQHDDVLSCLHGVQRCEGGTWTECADGTIHQFAANETPVRPSTELSSLGDAVNCQYSPCDPYCRNYVESPEDGITTTVGGGTGTGWLTGSLTNVPPGFAKKAIADTCSTAADCQMNTYCRFPDNGSCGHSKCAVGEALEDSCDPCVADICETSPECCQQEKPAACEHDPCAVGDALVANCSSCTTKICAAMPECCSGSWTAACVAAVATICEQTCGCCGGEQGFGGRCYNLETDTQKWDHAISGCEDRTSSGAWNMVAINDQAENDFVQGLNGGLATWIGLEQGDGVTENQWLWTSGDPAGIWLESTGLGVYDNFAAGQPSGSDDCAVMNASGGTWAAASCNDKYNRLCEGPPECIDGSPTVACSHDPCLQGAALADGCDSCVDRICDAMPSCCNTAWTAECVAAVATTCGNTCGCAAGEVARDGRCYFQDETDRTWSAARTSCQARGTGWDIATLTDSAENTFVNASVIDAHETWIGFSDATVQGTWGWATGSPAGNYVASGSTTSTAIAYGSSWKYQASNVDPGATWTAVSFVDSAWSTGNGQLGFGDSDEATAIVKNGPSYYFRKTFNLTQLPTAASLSVLYDDGYVAYINGVEVAREAISNVAHAQYSSGNVENAVETGSIAVSSLVVGSNVLAVLVKTRNSSDTDLSFDATLSVTTPLPTGGIFQNFASGEPNNDGDCARLNASNAGTWADASCTATKDSLCEGPYLPMIETGPRHVTGNGKRTAIPKRDVWSKLTNGSNPGSSWNTVAFDDSAWSYGYAELGFGDGDERTTFAAANPSYYFRRELEIEKIVTDATLTITFDDGFVAYVNGQQVASVNVSNAAHSAAASANSQDNEIYSTTIDTQHFVVGTNVIAVLVKNATSSGGDVSFDLQLDVTLNDAPPPPSTWSQACVDKVATVCGAVCDEANDPPLDTAVCTPWYPHETRETCAGVDLSIGVPCDGTIPVCNHGNTEAPAGIRIVSFPGNSQHMPNPNPNTSNAQQCFTQATIPAGECINVTGCPGLSGASELMVNPPGAGHVAECLTTDNWSVYHNGSCQTPACAGGTTVPTATKRPVDLVIIVDNSGSMAGKIEAVQERINQDFAAIASGGIDYRVIMMSRYGDSDIAVGGSDHPICVPAPLGGNSCVDAAHEPLLNNAPTFYHYSADIGSQDAWCKVLEAWNAPDELAADDRPWNPIAPNGLKELLRPEAFKEFLVISDDRINCSYGGHTFDDTDDVATATSEAAEFDAALLALSPEHFGTAQHRNYVWHSIVGLGANNPSDSAWLPSDPINTSQCTPGSESAGIGHQALSVLTGGLRYPSCQNNTFQSIFKVLADEVVADAAKACSFEVANEGFFDPARTSMAFSPSDGSAAIDFERVSSASKCKANQFYFRDDDTLVLCPIACDIVHDDPEGDIALDIGCQGGDYEETTYSQRYQAVCANGERPQWGFFAYNTQTPDDSKIEFRVRAALDEAGLTSANYELWATAAAATHTQVCSISGPTPCPIDMFEEFGGYPMAHFEWVEMEVTLIPSSSGGRAPVLDDWRFTYSCLPSE